jgi:hypothetical protein
MHFVIESRSGQSKACGGASGATNDPVRIAKNSQDVFTLDGFESAGAVLFGRFSVLLQFAQRNFQHSATRENYRTFNEVLQFSYVTTESWKTVMRGLSCHQSLALHEQLIS